MYVWYISIWHINHSVAPTVVRSLKFKYNNTLRELNILFVFKEGLDAGNICGVSALNFGACNLLIALGAQAE